MSCELSTNLDRRRRTYGCMVGLALACVSLVACQAHQSETPTNDWHPVVLADGRFRVRFPGAPESEDAQIDSPDGQVAVWGRKYHIDGMFFKALVLQFPAATIEAKPDKLAFVEQSSATWERAKTGAVREMMQTIADASVPAMEHRFSYPAGIQASGQSIQAGFAIHRSWLIENALATAFVDVLQSTYEANPELVNQRLDAFFEQIEIIPSPVPVD